ncbi:MAG: hypothetical protein K8F91_04965 [Candidatus Obscuribacterales bacterium]|nr:hypothetical protein [Candidatus Obscuribacterales bacterium]
MGRSGAESNNFWLKQQKASLGDTIASRTHTRISAQPVERSSRPAVRLPDAAISQNRLAQLKESYEVVSMDVLIERLYRCGNATIQKLIPRFRNFIRSLHSDGGIKCAFNRLLSLGSVEIASNETDYVRIKAGSNEMPLVTCSELIFSTVTRFDVTQQQRSLVLVDVQGIEITTSALEFNFRSRVQRISLALDQDGDCILSIRVENPLLSLKPSLPPHLNFSIKLP